jgi:N-acetylglutamate synthase-like GNAT family acetyltransferase
LFIEHDPNMLISPLADHPEYIERLAPPAFEHWQQYGVPGTLVDRHQKLRDHCQRERLSIAWVAHEAGQVFGTIALRLHDLPDYPEFSPWLGGLFVLPQYRQRGIGAALCQTVEQFALTERGVQTLYLFTLDRQDWYASLGWSALQPCEYAGNPGTIMQKALRQRRS